MSLPTNPSQSFIKRNPHLYPQVTVETQKFNPPPPLPQKRRIRQSTKPLLNKLEQEWFQWLTTNYSSWFIHQQCITLRLGNGLRYTPDLFAFDWPSPSDAPSKSMAWEVKGFFRDDAIVKIKVAAATYPEIRFVLVWKTKGEWKEQEVLA